jgi:hypothetical protein
MATIVLERWHTEPIGLPDLVQAHAAVPSGIVPLVHAMAPKGLQSISIFHAPNAEAVKCSASVLPSRHVDLWHAATNRDDGVASFRTSVIKAGPGALALVDKRFPIPVEIGVPANNFDPGDWCLNMHRVRYLHSHLAPERRRMVCIYAAADVETVVSAYRLIPVEIARIFRVALDPAVQINAEPAP